MSVNLLDRYDNKTAGEILAAAALMTSPSPVEADDLVVEYKTAVDELLVNIRKHLNLRADDRSVKATSSIDHFLSSAIDNAVLSSSSVDAALSRAGEAGRLSPALYKVEQPSSFVNRFYPLAVKKNSIQEAINSPDDFQHLLNDGAPSGDKNNLSFFVKLIPGRDKNKPHWLLVQTVRRGMTQVAQAAWRIFASDVDLMSAQEPIQLMSAFAGVFGVPVNFAGTVAKFVESKNVPFGSKIDIEVKAPPNAELFLSWSNRGITTDPNISNVGIAYAINLSQYKTALKAHGFNV